MAERIKSVFGWVVENLVPLAVLAFIAVSAWRMGALEDALIGHQAIGAHALQEQRHGEVARRLAVLETLVEALAAGRAGDRWTGSQMRLWASEFARNNEALVVPNPQTFTKNDGD